MIVNKNSLRLFKIVTDLCILNLVFAFSIALLQPIKLFIYHTPIIILLLILNISWVLSADTIGLYDDFRSRNYSFELINIIKNIFIQLIISILFLFFTKEALFSRTFITVFILLFLFCVGLKSFILKKVLAFLRRKGKNVRDMIIIGTELSGLSLKELIEKNTHFGYRLKGFVNNANSSMNHKYLGELNELENILERESVDDVVIALPSRQNDKIDSIIKICNKYAARVRIIPDYLQFTTHQHRISMFGDIPIITIHEQPLEEVQWRILKRLFDICFSGIILITIFPIIYLIIALIQSLTSPGPILFVQERIGKKDKVFKCYKFRSMHVKSSFIKEYKATEKNDPRITKLGKILRKTNIDELPQFINVLIGNMSIVGPRPHAISFNNKYSEFVEEIKMRHLVKPGITGWAQINGLRGDVSDEEENMKRTRKRIEFDLWYIENWSFGIDIQIILLTVWRMIKGDPNAH